MSRGVRLMAAVLVIGVVFSIMFPVLYTASQGPQTETVGQSVDDRVTLKPPLDAELTTVNTTDDTITVRLYNTETGVTNTSGSIGEGNNTTVVLDGVNVTVTNNQVTASDTASITYSFPVAVGWPDQAKLLLDNALVLLLLSGVVAILLFVAAVGEFV